MSRLEQTWRWVWRAARRVLELTFVDPVVQGRPHLRGWSSQLKATGAATAVVYLILTMLVMFSSQLRQTTLVLSIGSSNTLPQVTIPVVFGAVVWVLILVHAALLRMVWYLRLGLAVVVVGPTFLIVLSNVSRPIPLRALSALIYLALLIFILVRGRRRPAWWEFPVVGIGYLLVMFLSWLGPSFVSESGTDDRLVLVDLALTTLAPLAIPTLIAAGAVPAIVSVTAADAIARRPRPPRVLVVAGLVLLVSWRLYASISAMLNNPITSGWQSLVASALLTTVTAGAVALVWVLGGRPKEAPELGELPPVWSNWVLPVGALISLTYLSGVAFLVFRFVWLVLGLPNTGPVAWITDFLQVAGARPVFALVWLGLGAYGVVLARRHRVAESMLLAATAGFGYWVLVTGLVSVWWVRAQSLQSVASITSWLAIGLLVVWLATKRLTRTRVVAITTVMLVGALYGYRTVLDDPVSAAIGSAGVAALMFGLIWQVLTNAEVTRAGSRRFPHTTRIYLYLANGLFALVIVTFAVLSRQSTGLSPEDYQFTGDTTIGTPLLLATVLLALVIAFRNRPDTQTPPPADADPAAGHGLGASHPASASG